MFNFLSAFLTNSIRMLHIANRVIPMVKNVYPKISMVQSTIKKLVDSNFILANKNNDNNVNSLNDQGNNLDNKQNRNINTPTFFQ